MKKLVIAVSTLLLSNACFANIIIGDDYITPLKYCLGSRPPELSVDDNLQTTIASYVFDAQCEVDNNKTCISSYALDEFKVKWVSPCNGKLEDTFRCDDYNCWHMAT